MPPAADSVAAKSYRLPFLGGGGSTRWPSSWSTTGIRQEQTVPLVPPALRCPSRPAFVDFDSFNSIRADVHGDSIIEERASPWGYVTRNHSCAMAVAWWQQREV